MECRSSCGACCIALSISSPIPGMPEGKPAGVRCVNLDEKLKCRIWNTPFYPAVCRDFIPMLDACGNSADEAIRLLTDMELETAPVSSILRH